MEKQKLKLKKWVWVVLIVLVLLTIGITSFIKIRKNYLYKQTNEYKLLEKGYSDKEIESLKKVFDNNFINDLTNKDKDKTLLLLINNKLFNKNNLDRYIEYMSNNKNTTLENTLKMVNTNNDKTTYDDAIVADTTKGNLILVNKLNLLEEKFVPKDLTIVSSKYAYGENSLSKDAYEAFVIMWNNAYKDNVTLIINLGYRTYEKQNSLYTKYKAQYGIRKADSIAARPGASEHQTGLAMDIYDFKNKNPENFEDTDAYKWLIENSYKYGFILRYPNDKENITLFNSEPWHYRYVGKEASSFIHTNNITFEEYYYEYLNK